MDWEAIADAVVRRRKDLGMRQKELADATGYDPSTIRNVEHHARSSYDPLTLPRISRALDWPSDALERIGRGEPYEGIRLDPPAARSGDTIDMAEELRRLREEVAELRRELRERD